MDKSLQPIFSNDANGIKRVYNEYFPIALFIVNKYKGSVEDAEDIFQEAMIAVFKKAKSEGSDFLTVSASTFIYSVCHKQYLMKMRNKGKMVRVDVINEQELQLIGVKLEEIESVEKMMIKKEERDIVQKALDTIGEPCREMLILYGNDYKYKEIAEVLSIQLNGLGVKITRCLEKLEALILKGY